MAILVILLWVASIAFAWVITGYSPFTLLIDAMSGIIHQLQKRSGNAYNKNKTDFSRMSRKEKRKSKRYKFHSFLNEIMLDLGWKDAGITVEGYNLLLQLGGIIIGLIALFSGVALLMSVFLGTLAYVLLVALSFLCSRMAHARRKEALMAAEDILSISMSQGIVNAVERALPSIDPLVRPAFKSFYDEVYLRNVDVKTAIIRLNERCGELFDSFCEKAITFEAERRPGMDSIFQYNIKINSTIRLLDHRCDRAFRAMNKNFLMSIAILFGFLTYTMLSMYEMFEFYMKTDTGKAILCLYIAGAAITFIYSQYVQSKPFKYGNGIKFLSDDAVREYESTEAKITRYVKSIKNFLPQGKKGE